MKGAIVFLIVFVLGLGITLGYPTLPPGRQIYDMLNVPDVEYPVLGISATLLIVAIFNGVVYGIVVWLIFTIIWAATGRGKKQQQPTIQQTVNVNVEGKEKEVKTETEKKPE